MTVQRASFDKYNDATYVDHHVIDGCLEYPTSSSEDDRAVTDSRTLLVPSGSDVTPMDRIRMKGLLYQVYGLPMDWVDPFTGWAPGMQVILERVN